MTRDIDCAVCGEYLGVIRDARLRKDINYICNTCLDLWVPKEGYAKEEEAPSEDQAVNMLRTMFGIK